MIEWQQTSAHRCNSHFAVSVCVLSRSSIEVYSAYLKFIDAKCVQTEQHQAIVCFTQLNAMNISVIYISIHGLIIDGIDVHWAEKKAISANNICIFICNG